MKKQVIIVAGGSGKRMGAVQPKQFLVIAGKPVLMHTIERFSTFDQSMQIIVALPETYFDFWKSLCKKYDFHEEHVLARGGLKRFDSVKAGLSFAGREGLIAVHDGVRPLVDKNTIGRVFEVAAKKGNAIPVVPVSQSVRLVGPEGNRPFDRRQLRMVQTPQCFHAGVLQDAYLQEYRTDFTDDATVVESLGKAIHLTEGNSENIKVTKPADLRMAESLLR